MRSTDSRASGWTLPTLVLAGVLVFALALVPMVVAGCGGDEEATTTTLGPTSSETMAETTTTAAMVEETTTTLFDIHSVTSSTATTAVTSSTSTTEALSSAETRLPSGNIKAMGFIDRVWESGGKRYIRIDYAEMITNRDAATAAARAAGDIGPTEEWDLDWYIANVNPLKREFEVSNSVAITTSTRWVPGGDWEAPCTWSDFKSFWGPGPFPESEGPLRTNPWWIERNGNVVVKIDEQYLP